MSIFTAWMALVWSSVSTYGKLASSSFCQGESALNANPRATCRVAYSSSNSCATLMTSSRTFCLALPHSAEPRRVGDGGSAFGPMYRLSRSA